MEFSLGTSTGIRSTALSLYRKAQDSDSFREAISIGGLGLALLILLGVVAWTWWAALHPAAARCHNAPLRVTQVPQLLGIAVCVGGFVLGRVSARRKVHSRAELKSGAERGDDDRRGQNAVYVQAALTGALLLTTGLLAFEAVTLANGVWPITYYLRCANESASLATLGAAFAFWLLIGRWLWLPAPPRVAH